MWSLIRKEISSFLSSITGYVVMVVFLLTTGLFMWGFSGNLNVMDMGFANLDTLFYVAPWVFMFLIPAITMRSFSEEKRTGTIEWLFTRPLTDMQIIWSKYLAGFLLVFVSLIPTIIYFISVYELGAPEGNIDLGGTWGSYIGLLFLGAGFVSIGLFASSVTENQVIAFIVAVFLCFFFFSGFQQLASFALFGSLDRTVQLLGISAHYQSMSRGVLDTRDIIYFAALIASFLILTRTVLQSRKW